MESQSVSGPCWETPEVYLAGRVHLFPSLHSLKWFMRSERDRLIKSGALRKLAGRVLIEPSSFDAVVEVTAREAMLAGALPQPTGRVSAGLDLQSPRAARGVAE